MEYFSDRKSGPRPRADEVIQHPLWGGLVSLIDSRIADGSFGYEYPEGCDDSPNTVVGTNRYGMGLAVLAEVPELSQAVPSGRPRYGTSQDFTGWPLRSDALPPTPAVLDLVEFCHHHVAEPVPGDHHSFFGHRHIKSYNRPSGMQRWQDAVNRLFSRNGVAYELTTSGQIIRLGTPIVTDAVIGAAFDTGDDELDALLDRARAKYLSTDTSVRGESLEQLWDAFERLKTLRCPDKKEGISQLVSEVSSGKEMANELNAEAKHLTAIGNAFRIRHHETTKIPVDETEVDYLFHRAFALIAQLLRIHPHG
jgi:hypothetical protein